jgi:hypothetical protein
MALEKHTGFGIPTILSQTTGINAKTTGTTTLYTVPTGKRAYVTSILFHCTTATSFTVEPTLGVGVAAGEADIMPSTALTGFTALDKVYRYSPEGTYVSNAASDVIKLGIDTGATATTATIEVFLIGFLI